jgi:LEA14-like dessication related protein
VIAATLAYAVDLPILMVNSMKQLYTKTLTRLHSKNSAPFLTLFCLIVCLNTGCTSLRPNFETPSIGVTSFKPLTSQSLTPQFEIGMRVVNPNATKLNLRGMSYKVFLNDSEVVAGATNVLPEVPAYGEAEFKVIATIGLIEGIRFVGGLLQNTPGQIAYRIQTKLDIGAMDPAIRIDQTGSFSP